MNFLKTIILFLILTQAQRAQLQQQDYITYHKSIMGIESLLSNDSLEMAVEEYDRLFHLYDFVFARDAYNACQLAALTSSTHMPYFYKRCIEAGISTQMLQANSRINVWIKKNSSQRKDLEKDGMMKYNSRIDHALRDEWIERFQLEQEHKLTSTYKDICTANFNRIRELAKAGKFPGEQRIGPDDQLENSFVFSTLKHYPNSYKLLEKEIEEGIRQGQIQPLSALYIYGFNQTRTSVLYTAAVPDETNYFQVCYNLPFGKMSRDIDAVNKARASKYISSVDTMQKVEQVMQQYGLVYKEGW